MAEEQQPSSGSSDVEQNKTLAVIGYLGILFLVPMLAAPKSQFAQYHARQGMALFIVMVISGVIAIVPFVGWVLSPLLWLFSVILMILGMVSASKGEMKPLPVIGQWAIKK